MDRMEFFSQVFEVVAAIPKGKVATYGQIAWMIGAPNRSRMVGQAMHYAPDELPCHRVVNSVGRLVPGWTEQRRLLLKEGVPIKANGCVDLKQCRWMWCD